MRRVRQLDDNGCGIACVAMIAGITYTEARKQMFGNKPLTYTKSKELQKALRRHGIRIDGRLRPLGKRNYKTLARPAILKVRWTKSGPFHWVVWDIRRRRVLDPLEPPYTRFRVTSFLSLQSN